MYLVDGCLIGDKDGESEELDESSWFAFLFRPFFLALVKGVFPS